MCPKDTLLLQNKTIDIRHLAPLSRQFGIRATMRGGSRERNCPKRNSQMAYFETHLLINPKYWHWDYTYRVSGMRRLTCWHGLRKSRNGKENRAGKALQSGIWHINAMMLASMHKERQGTRFTCVAHSRAISSAVSQARQCLSVTLQICSVCMFSAIHVRILEWNTTFFTRYSSSLRSLA